MIIYNVTVKVAADIAAGWLTWLKEEHIPDIIHTGCFTHAVVHQLMETDDTEGPTYIVQYHTQSKALYNSYIEIHSGKMREKAIKKWGGNFIAFRTVMQEMLSTA